MEDELIKCLENESEDIGRLIAELQQEKREIDKRVLLKKLLRRLKNENFDRFDS